MITKEKIKKYKSYKARAEKKGIAFSLTEDTFYAALHTQCYICGKNGQRNELGLDRINNESGYIEGNIAPCCWDCNRVKSNLTAKNFLPWLKRICPTHPLITKGHSQPKGIFLGQEVIVDVYLNPKQLELLK